MLGLTRSEHSWQVATVREWVQQGAWPSNGEGHHEGFATPLFLACIYAKLGLEVQKNSCFLVQDVVSPVNTTLE